MPDANQCHGVRELFLNYAQQSESMPSDILAQLVKGRSRFMLLYAPFTANADEKLCIKFSSTARKARHLPIWLLW